MPMILRKNLFDYSVLLMRYILDGYLYLLLLSQLIEIVMLYPTVFILIIACDIHLIVLTVEKVVVLLFVSILSILDLS